MPSARARRGRLTGFAVDEAPVAGQGMPAHVQVTPTELMLTPGQSVRLRARLFDDKGRFLREDPTATWALEGINGTVTNGTLTVAIEPGVPGGTDQRHRRRR